MKTANLYGCVLTSESRLRLECTAFARPNSHGRLVRFKLKQIHIAAFATTLCVAALARAAVRGEEKTLTTIYEYDGRKISWQIRNATLLNYII